MDMVVIKTCVVFAKAQLPVELLHIRQAWQKLGVRKQRLVEREPNTRNKIPEPPPVIT
jgi:hypothetical protein